MIKKYLFIFAISLLLVGCSKTETVIKQIDYKAPTFELDSKSIRKEDVSSTKDVEYSFQNGNTHDNIIYRASEIKLIGSDTSTNYIIDGTDIVYNNIRFKELYSLVNEIEYPYETNNLLNFIIKTFNSYGNTEVTVELYRDNMEDVEVSVDGGAPLTMHDSLSGYDGYIQISNKYNDVAVWNLSLYVGNKEHLASLYGCKSFILYNGTDTLEVDMTKFDSIKEEVKTNETITNEIKQEETVSAQENSISNTN